MIDTGNNSTDQKLHMFYLATILPRCTNKIEEILK